MPQEERASMAASGRCRRMREGQRWLHAAVVAILAQASLPLASPAVHHPAVYWDTQAQARPTLVLWLAEDATPRHLPFPRALIEDCGAGGRPRHAYARSYMLRRLRQMGLRVP